jgi:hypothetical protein
MGDRKKAMGDALWVGLVGAHFDEFAEHSSYFHTLMVNLCEFVLFEIAHLAGNLELGAEFGK